MQSILITLLFVAPDWVLKLMHEQRPNNVFWSEYIVWPVIQIVVVLFIVLTLIAYLVYLERKVSAFIQARLGPMRVGPWGLLQPLADGLKLLLKEDIIPIKADRAVFMIAPIISVVAALVVLVVVPWGAAWATIANVNIGVLFILAVSSVGVLGLVLAGWSSNSKYSLLGALRSSAQMVSYEIGMGLSIIGALMFARTLSMSGIIDAQRADGMWYILFQPLGFLVYAVSALDVAALPVRPGYGARMEVDDTRRACQHRVDRDLVRPGAAESAGWRVRVHARREGKADPERVGHALFHRHCFHRYNSNCLGLAC